MGLSVPPMGLAYIASSLLEAGHEVESLDAYALGWSWNRLSQWIQSKHFDVLGCTVMTPTLDIIARAIAICRPFVDAVVVGGPHPTAVKEQIFVDIPCWCSCCGRRRVTSVAAYRNGNGTFPAGVLERGKEFIPASPPDIHALPMPARHLLPNHKYRYLFSSHARIGTMITSRGCPFRCSFCDKSVGGSRWRARNAQEVVNELWYMKHELGIGFVNFYDDNFTLHRAPLISATRSQERSSNLMEMWGRSWCD